MEFSYQTRKKDLQTLNGRYFDIIIVGGGIAGAGVASILSTNGLSVLLIDKGDFGSGTSSNSSKLIHGGIRYLGQGHILLTRELLRERNYLMKNTDIVKGTDFDILIDEKSWRRSTISLGLFLYGLMGHDYHLPKFKKGKYNYKGFRGYFTYMDAVTDDALLVIYNVITAKMLGAVAINYLEAKGFKEENGIVKIDMVDTIEGGNFTARAKVIVNATGPWIGEIFSNYIGKKMENFKLSKGVHLILKADKFPYKNAIAFKSDIDGRQMFIIPRGETVIAGTTDDFVTTPEEWNVKESEKQYILESVRRVFNNISEEDVIGSYSGIRPLYGKGDDPGRVTRDFHIEVSGKMVSVMGVKITNYRNASRKVAKQVGSLLGKRISVNELPQILYKRESGNEIEIAIKNECALTIEDVIRRRVGYFYFRLDQGKSKIREIEDAIGKIKNINNN